MDKKICQTAIMSSSNYIPVKGNRGREKEQHFCEVLPWKCNQSAVYITSKPEPVQARGGSWHQANALTNLLMALAHLKTHTSTTNRRSLCVEQQTVGLQCTALGEKVQCRSCTVASLFGLHCVATCTVY